MRAKYAFAVIAITATGLMGASSAFAAPTSTGDLTLTAQNVIYKEIQRPVNLTLDVNVIPEVGALTLKPLVNVMFKFPVGLDLVADANKTIACPLSSFGPDNANVPTESVRVKCPDSILGDGTADLYLAQTVAADIHDPTLTIFDGGKDSNGDTVITIHGYSATLNQGIYMSGVIRNGKLNVAIPRLPVDTSVSHFQLNIPGSIGQDSGYVRASCLSSHWKATAIITLAKRDEAGVETERETLDPPAVSRKACTGLTGKARLGGIKVKGPRKVVSGKKGAFKVTLSNSGTASAQNIKIVASGAGKGSTKVRRVAPGTSKSVTVEARVKGKKGKRATVKFRVHGGGRGAGKVKVRIG